MGTGSIREGETNRVPFDKAVWFVVVTVVDNEIVHNHFHNTIIGKQFLLGCLMNLKEPYKIYAVWHGVWSTDLFNMDKSVLIKRLKEL